MTTAPPSLTNLAVERVDVTSSNVQDAFDLLCTLLKQPDAVCGLDLEFGALVRGDVRNESVADRIERWASAPRATVFEVGLAVVVPSQQQAALFSLMITPSPRSAAASDGFFQHETLRYLHRAGFSFDEWQRRALPHVAQDADSSVSFDEAPVNRFVDAVLEAGVPVIVHNGFNDVALVQHHLFHPIDQRATASAVIGAMAPRFANVYDNKTLACACDKSLFNGMSSPVLALYSIAAVRMGVQFHTNDAHHAAEDAFMQAMTWLFMRDNMPAATLKELRGAIFMWYCADAPVHLARGRTASK